LQVLGISYPLLEGAGRFLYYFSPCRLSRAGGNLKAISKQAKRITIPSQAGNDEAPRQRSPKLFRHLVCPSGGAGGGFYTILHLAVFPAQAGILMQW